MSSKVDRQIAAVYGIVADPEKLHSYNLAFFLNRQSAFLLLSRPRNLACHNLCTYLQPPKNHHSLLGLGLNFCPKPKNTTGLVDFQPVADRFCRDLYTQMVFAGSPDDYNPKQLFIRTDWEPDRNTVPVEFRARVAYFLKQLKASFVRRRVTSNLTPYQQKLLADLRRSKEFIVLPSDKNLGPCILEREEYVVRVLEHLADDTTYRQLSPAAAHKTVSKVEEMIFNFIGDFHKVINDPDEKFLYRSLDVADPFAYFYIMAKVHKKPRWLVRPIASVSGSITHGLGQSLDQQLKPIVQQLPSYINSSLQLKLKLERLAFQPARASFFTCDAVSMYTNIDTDHALEKIAHFLRSSPLCRDCPSGAIICGLEILMRHNVFKFGDTFWIQKQGTAMGTPPAPNYATLYFGIHELDIAPRFQSSIAAYHRYIDDCLTVWIHHPDPAVDQQNLTAFQEAMNSYGKLAWEFTPLEKTVHFLDLTLTITERGIQTRLFEKEMNLYLYIPPHSAHSPGVLRGLVIGMTLRIVRLTTALQDKKNSLRSFFLRLCNRGYSSDTLRKLFAEALAHTEQPTFDEKWWIREKRCFLHLPFHPDDPSSTVVQRLFHQHLLNPPAEPPLPDLCNYRNCSIGTNRLIVAYHRPNNLKNLFFP